MKKGEDLFRLSTGVFTGAEAIVDVPWPYFR